MFDMGPSFMSMTYELDESFGSIGEDVPVEMVELESLYQVFFEGQEKSRIIWKDLQKLEQEFADIEPDLAKKAEKYLDSAGEFFHDTESKVIKSNFPSDYHFI